MRYARTMGSCGVRQIYDLPYDPASAIKSVQKKFDRVGNCIGHDLCALVCFSDVTRGRGSNGSRLAEYITKKKLGKIMASDSTRNPNSGNHITVWIWHVDVGALERFKE